MPCFNWKAPCCSSIFFYFFPEFNLPANSTERSCVPMERSETNDSIHATGTDTRTHYTRPVTEIRKEDCEILIRLALEEDAPDGDPTSESIFPPGQAGRARVVSNEGGILCGSSIV